MAYPWSAGEQLNAADLNAAIQFGGDGSDGAKIVSADENLDASNAVYVVKNYTDLTIDITKTLTLTNHGTTYGTLLHIKVSGDCIINGKIDGSGVTGDGKGGAFQITNCNGSAGTGGSPAAQLAKGGNGGNGAAGYGGIGATGATGTNNAANTANAAWKQPYYTLSGYLNFSPGNKFLIACCGGTGGTGGAVSGGSGGGLGGGGGVGLILEVRGNLTFGASSEIDLAGGTGGVGGTGDGSYGEGGGGGGAGGIGVCIYGGNLTDSGLTKTVTAGPGGAGGGNGGAGGASVAGYIGVFANNNIA